MNNEISKFDCLPNKNSKVEKANKIAALYLFVPLVELDDLKQKISKLCATNDITGALILSPEGINGTISASPDYIDHFMNTLKSMPSFGPIGNNVKYSYSEEKPFYRMRVLIKAEIISMGVSNLDPCKLRGIDVEPQDWNQLISQPDVAIIDTRNDFEVELGTFQGAINPRTQTFKQFPQFIETNFNPNQIKKVAMFCTGGIRCEKASSWMTGLGYEVYSLKGGILKYLEEIPTEQSLWNGECYVFDSRVAVSHGLHEGSYTSCKSCRHPLKRGEETCGDYYEDGISCAYCYHTQSLQHKQRVKERQLQCELAKQNHEKHLGQQLKKHHMASRSPPRSTSQTNIIPNEQENDYHHRNQSVEDTEIFNLQELYNEEDNTPV